MTNQTAQERYNKARELRRQKASAKLGKDVPKDQPKVLYRLPELMAAPATSTIYLTESEGAADTLAKLSFVATTAGGVSTIWTQGLLDPLKERRVVIIVDADQPGREYGEKVARMLDKIAASIKIIDLYPERSDGADISDFLATDRAAVKFAQLVKDAPAWEPRPEKPKTDEELIAELAALPPLEYERRREAEAKKLGVRVAALDKAVAKARGEEVGDDKQGRAVCFPEIEPWPESVDGAALLDDMAEAIGKHVVMSEHDRIIASLWAAHAYLLDQFFISPRLAIRSSFKRCGKTTLLDVLARLVPRALPTANITPSAVFRVVEAYRPTLLIDEADTFMKENEELRGVLNSGHRHGGAVVRTVGDDHEPRSFATYSACAIALIGSLPDTLHDRAVSITLKRRLPSEPISPFRLDRTEHLDELARKIARFAADNAHAIGAADPAMPEGVFNRAADNWRSLLAIADAAGGDWPERARKAAMADSETAESSSRLEQLLPDIRTVFATQETDRLPSADLIKDLVAMEARPWAEYGKSRKPLSQHQLARLLKPLGIGPVQIRFSDDDSRKGYRFEHFEDVFLRYCPAEGASKPKQRNKCDEQGTSDLFQTETNDSDVTVAKCEKSNNDGECFGVSDREGGNGEMKQTDHPDGPGDPGLPQSEIDGLARDYLARADAQTVPDQKALDQRLREALARLVAPDDVETEFERVMAVAFATDLPATPLPRRGEPANTSPKPDPALAGLSPGAEVMGRAPPGERCFLCGKGGSVLRIRLRPGAEVDYLHAACAAELGR